MNQPARIALNRDQFRQLVSGEELAESDVRIILSDIGFDAMYEAIDCARGLPRSSAPQIAQEDDPELLEWLAAANQYGGGFISSIARAALVADYENYPLLRPLLMQLRKKYPRYEPSEAVKREI